MRKKLLVIQAAALGADLLHRDGITEIEGMPVHSMETVFPALTCTAQASFRTAAPPAGHGMVANGRYLRELSKVMFWEQSANLVHGPRIWDEFTARGGRVGVLFWQQSLGERVDMVLSPAPIHKHSGGMIMDCLARPADLYSRLRDRLGGFKLHRYWGPLASSAVGDWIAGATAYLLEAADAPDVLLTYLPTLDYDLQRCGPRHPRSGRAVARLMTQLSGLIASARRANYEVIVFGDYAIGPCDGAAYPNQALREAGLLATRRVKKMVYPDLYHTRAFAMVDHEVAHVYVRDTADVPAVRETLAGVEGIAELLEGEELSGSGLDHPNSGKLVAIAEQGKWLAYPWWHSRSERPDYATHIDIHNKPGYDPCELFMGFPPPSVSQDTSRIRGTHGRAGAGRKVAWASTLELAEQPETLTDLAGGVRDWLSADV